MDYGIGIATQINLRIPVHCTIYYYTCCAASRRSSVPETVRYCQEKQYTTSPKCLSSLERGVWPGWLAGWLTEQAWPVWTAPFLPIAGKDC